LNRSSKARRALLLGLVEPLLAGGVPVCRSTVVRGVNSVHRLRSSFGATRAGSLSCCVHSQRTLVSNDAHWMHACRSTPQRERRASTRR
jgi:hypothetical protein